ncbi:AraC family transcriptional regulator [Paenibacillus rhizovicinus]|uniref:AraC family transcriptional regulator n=1 Tax=Paenibacillus rhizovicinus TaxID=2704463 RepID=A0A6C0P361_9BACL|nr:helix-turn-helix domain-containing protein [Paenibacillus rhizovicinus]QHW32919.1 AraC family transcriptional regulator [Paenibacillus rhizovicinus]
MSYADAVQRALDYIEDYLDDDEALDLAALAEEAYASVAQLYRMFYALTGHPVKDYIRKRRMSVAANHLRYSKRTVEELAGESGFASYHAFAKVFKKIVGLTPAAYRSAGIHYSFEPIRLGEQFAYMEDKEQSERFPDIKVIRFQPGTMAAYLHISEQEAGMENEAFRIVYEKLAVNGSAVKRKTRIFGYNVDLPNVDGHPRYGYRVLVLTNEPSLPDGDFEEEPFPGGLYAVRKIAAASPETVQDGWNRLVSEWLPKSSFELGRPPYIEEFIAYNGKVTRMHLFLPVLRKRHRESIEIVRLSERRAYCFRGYGEEAQTLAEQRLMDWHATGRADCGERRVANEDRYYMSFPYGVREAADYWWENGFISAPQELALNTAPTASWDGPEERRFDAGDYACCVTKTYGLLTGVLDNMHRWIAASESYRLDEGRQWYAEYRALPGMDVERDTIVSIYLPIRPSREHHP